MELIHHRNIITVNKYPNLIWQKVASPSLSPLTAANGVIQSWPPSDIWYLGSTCVSPQAAYACYSSDQMVQGVTMHSIWASRM